jgi:ketoreductase
MSADLHGQHAVVTGGGRGIGAAIAGALAACGARVTLMARTAAAVEETAHALRTTTNAIARGIACDVSNPADVRRAFEQAVGASGTVQILVNNAGQAREAEAFETISLDTWNRLIAVNLTGTMLCTQQVLPAMRAAGSGRIVNIASTAGLRGYAGLAPYCASKHGVIGLTRALAAETARSGITVNAVCPGYVETPMAQRVRAGYAAAYETTEDAILDKFQSKIPLGRYSTPEEVAGMVAYLASDTAASVTAQAINVCGGLGNF